MNAVIRQMLKFLSLLFIFMSLVFLLTNSPTVMASFLLASFTAGLSSLFVLRFSVIAHVRTANATSRDMKEGFQVALHSSMVVALLSGTPSLFCLSLMSIAWDARLDSISAYGFGVILVTLLVRIGGAIFGLSVI